MRICIKVSRLRISNTCSKGKRSIFEWETTKLKRKLLKWHLAFLPSLALPFFCSFGSERVSNFIPIMKAVPVKSSIAKIIFIFFPNFRVRWHWTNFTMAGSNEKSWDQAGKEPRTCRSKANFSNHKNTTTPQNSRSIRVGPTVYLTLTCKENLHKILICQFNWLESKN